MFISSEYCNDTTVGFMTIMRTLLMVSVNLNLSYGFSLYATVAKLQRLFRVNLFAIFSFATLQSSL